jgi:iron complex transport system substrate-binding protein
MRIVSLLPSATEILCAIGAGEDLVGITHECDYPEGVRSLPRVTSAALEQAGTSAEIDRHVKAALHAGSSLYNLDSELLETLKPDLIVTQELCQVCAVDYRVVARAAKRLSTDPRIVSLEPSTLDEVFDTIAFLGDITGHARGAAELLAGLRARTDRLEREVAEALYDTGGRRPRALILEWTDPPMSGGHWTPGLVERAGAEALLGNPGANSRVLSWDQIASADPDVVVVAPCGFDLAATRDAVGEIAGVPQWRELRAHRRNEVYLLDGNAYLNRPGPRLIDTAEMLATMLFEDSIDIPVLDPHAWEPLHA